MTTTLASLVDKARNMVGAWGDARTTLGGAVSDTTGASLTVASNADIDGGAFLLIENEMMEVISTSSTTGVTVVRGARGSAGATHANGSLVRINPIWSNNEILDAINEALFAAYPYLYTAYDDKSLSVVRGQYEYNFPSGVRRIARLEVETYDGSGDYEIFRQWSLQDKDTFCLDGEDLLDEGATIRVIGVGTFTAGALAGNLDSNYPTDAVALEYLVVSAAARMLMTRQAYIARRDSFIGVTDNFGANRPDQSIIDGKRLLDYSKQLLKQCRMQPPQEYMSDPGRHYIGRRG